MKNLNLNIGLFLGLLLAPCFSQTTVLSLPTVNMDSTAIHQKELMGKNRSPASIDMSEKANEVIAQYVLDVTSQNLPKKYKTISGKVASTIIKEANRYGMDPLFVTAVIEQESSFNPDLIGTVKEVGLMQVRPETAKWLNKKYHLTKAKKINLRDPATNIKFGVFFLSTLRSKFDKNSRHYISAYNMGATNLRRNLKHNRNPKEYVQNVMKHYVKYMQDLSVIFKAMAASSRVASN